MTSQLPPTRPTLLTWIERWNPEDAEHWDGWRRTLSHTQRHDGLLPLQAALSGLVAFRHLENHPVAAPAADLRPHLRAVHAVCNWALGLVTMLQGERRDDRLLRAIADPIPEPQRSLEELRHLLVDACRVSERLLDLPDIDTAAFAASCDLTLRTLDRNPFFRPPEPLEFSNVAELVGPDHFPPELQSWTSEAAKTTTVVAFLTLLRSHRFLGIADRELAHEAGLLRAHVVLCAVRRELRELTRFLMIQGVETYADELEQRLLSTDARHATGVRTEITRASRDLRDLRASVETLAMHIHDESRAQLEEPLPDLSEGGSLALLSERMRNGIREMRFTAKSAAKELLSLCGTGAEATTGPKSERVPSHLQHDIWAFRLIARAFVAKAHAAEDLLDVESLVGAAGPELGFVAEFVRHFRVFGPRIARATDYAARGSLISAMSAVSRQDSFDLNALRRATDEASAFLIHLDHTFDPSQGFDKEAAAVELRDYLTTAKQRPKAARAAAAAFGLMDPGHAEAG